MAITYTDNGGGAPNGSDKEFTYTFPVIQTEDVKVALNGVTQATTKYTVDNVSNPTKITFNTTNPTSGLQVTSGANQGAPLTGVRVRVYRETTVGKANGDEDPKAVFAAGSSIRAIDLNANHEQALMAIHELQDRPIETEDIQNDAITADKIADNAVGTTEIANGAVTESKLASSAVTQDKIANNAVISAKIPDGHILQSKIADGAVNGQKIAADAITGAKIADNQIDSEHYVDGSIDHVHLANDVIDGDNIQNDVINSEHYVALSIDTEHIANENVTTAKLAPDAVTSAKLADNAVDSEHYVDGSVDHVHLANDAVDGDNIADNSINSEHYVDGSIDHVHLANDVIDGDNIQDSVINSEHYVDGSIDREHLAADIVDGTKIADDSINSEHIAAGALDNEHYAAGSITSDKLNGATVITASEQASATANDTSFLTSAAADARFFNVSTGDTIKDGDTFPDNDTTIATTAAINDRIIDLVDDVGGFVPIANETSFPTANPDVNGGAGTIVSVKAASTNLTAQSGTTLTIANGRGTGNAVIITGVSATIPSGFGFLVETTTTDHTYAFHRLVPKATEVTTVAGKAVEIGRLGTADAVADMAILGTADVVADLNTLGTADVVADMNTLGTADVVADMNTLAVTSVVNNMDTVATNVANVNTTAGSISNVNTTAGSIANVNTVAGSIANVNTTAGSITNVNSVAGSIANVNTTASNLANVNNFANTYQIASSNPSTDGGGNSLAAGDLYFNTSSNELRVYNGSSWQGGVTATGNLAGLGSNTFTGDQTIQSTAPTLNFTDTNGNPDYRIISDGGALFVQGMPYGAGAATRMTINTDGHFDFATNVDFASGIDVTGNITVSGNVDGRDVAADGTKLDGIESNAINASNTAITNKLPLAGGTLTGTTTFANGVEAVFGSGGSDGLLKIKADAGGNSYITEQGAGDLTIQSTGNGVQFQKAGTSEFLAKFKTDAEVELYHNGLQKFETTSSGISVTGNIAVSGTVDGRDIATDGTKLDGIEASATADQTAAEIKTLLQSNKLTTNEIGTNAVSTGQINDNAVDSNQIKSDAVVTSKIAALAITTNRIANDAVTADKLADTSVTAGSYGSATAIPAITVDAQGRITAASTNAVNTTTNLSTSTATGSVTVNSSTGNNATISEATSSAAGVMSTAHHDKLDGIETGATADQTNSEIAAALSDQRPSMKGATLTDDGTASPVLHIKADNGDPWGLIIGNDSYSTGMHGLRVYVNNNGDIDSRVSGNSEYRTWNIKQDDGSTVRNLVTLSSSGSVELRHQGNFKLGTTSTGVSVTGNIAVSGTVDGVDIAALNSTVSGITSNATHSGEVTGATSLTIADNVVDEANLKVSNSPQNGYMLTAQSGNTGGLTWAPAAAGATGASNDEIFWENGTNVTANYTITNGKNAGSFGPITINSGVTVTVGAGETWTVV